MSKQKDIETYINTIVGATVTTTALATASKCSLPTVLAYIKNNPQRFTRVSRGKYTINASVTSNTDTSNLPTHEW